MCGHPYVEDTSITQLRPNNDAATVDVPEGFNVAQLENPTEIESILRNSSLDGCKEGL
jgi:hypothetical protein